MALEMTQLLESEDKSYQSVHPSTRTQAYDQKLTEVKELVFQGQYHGEHLSKHRRAYLIHEALTTSDFPMLFGDVLDRQVLAKYQAVPGIFTKIARQSLIVDFRLNRRFRIWGADSQMSQVQQGAEYPIDSQSDIEYPLQAYKYGKRFDIDWEAIINDDLGALQDTPDRFANAALRTEGKLFTTLYANNVGAHMVEATKPSPTTYYLFAKSAANSKDSINCVTTALSIDSLTAGLAAMSQFMDPNGEIIQNEPKYLVVPPVLELPARSILTSTWRMWIDQNGGNTPTAYPTANPVSQMGLQLVVDPYLQTIDSSNGTTGWYLFSDPAFLPALEFAHMQGHEVPEIAMHASNKITVGGAPMAPMSGDFETDTIKYRVRIINAMTKLDWRGAYMGGAVN